MLALLSAAIADPCSTTRNWARAGLVGIAVAGAGGFDAHGPLGRTAITIGVGGSALSGIGLAGSAPLCPAKQGYWAVALGLPVTAFAAAGVTGTSVAVADLVRRDHPFLPIGIAGLAVFTTVFVVGTTATIAYQHQFVVMPVVDDKYTGLQVNARF